MSFQVKVFRNWEHTKESTYMHANMAGHQTWKENRSGLKLSLIKIF